MVDNLTENAHIYGKTSIPLSRGAPCDQETDSALANILASEVEECIIDGFAVATFCSLRDLKIYIAKLEPPRPYEDKNVLSAKTQKRRSAVSGATRRRKAVVNETCVTDNAAAAADHVAGAKPSFRKFSTDENNADEIAAANSKNGSPSFKHPLAVVDGGSTSIHRFNEGDDRQSIPENENPDTAKNDHSDEVASLSHDEAPASVSRHSETADERQEQFLMIQSPQSSHSSHQLSEVSAKERATANNRRHSLSVSSIHSESNHASTAYVEEKSDTGDKNSAVNGASLGSTQPGEETVQAYTAESSSSAQSKRSSVDHSSEIGKTADSNSALLSAPGGRAPSTNTEWLGRLLAIAARACSESGISNGNTANPGAGSTVPSSKPDGLPTSTEPAEVKKESSHHQHHRQHSNNKNDNVPATMNKLNSDDCSIQKQGPPSLAKLPVSSSNFDPAVLSDMIGLQNSLALKFGEKLNIPQLLPENGKQPSGVKRPHTDSTTPSSSHSSIQRAATSSKMSSDGSKKHGMWCTAHVRIAWFIYKNQQQRNGGNKGSMQNVKQPYGSAPNLAVANDSASSSKRPHVADGKTSDHSMESVLPKVFLGLQPPQAASQNLVKLRDPDVRSGPGIAHLTTNRPSFTAPGMDQRRLSPSSQTIRPMWRGPRPSMGLPQLGNVPPVGMVDSLGRNKDPFTPAGLTREMGSSNAMLNLMNADLKRRQAEQLLAANESNAARAVKAFANSVESLVSGNPLSPPAHPHPAPPSSATNSIAPGSTSHFADVIRLLTPANPARDFGAISNSFRLNNFAPPPSIPRPPNPPEQPPLLDASLAPFLASLAARPPLLNMPPSSTNQSNGNSSGAALRMPANANNPAHLQFNSLFGGFPTSRSIPISTSNNPWQSGSNHPQIPTANGFIFPPQQR